MDTKNKKKDEKTSIDYTIANTDIDWSIDFTNTISDDKTIIWPSTNTSPKDAFILNYSNNWHQMVTFTDPYSELEELRTEQEDEEKLREEYPCLQEAYENYQLIKKLLQDEECDKYFEDRMKVFKR